MDVVLIELIRGLDIRWEFIFDFGSITQNPGAVFRTIIPFDFGVFWVFD